MTGVVIVSPHEGEGEVRQHMPRSGPMRPALAVGLAGALASGLLAPAMPARAAQTAQEPDTPLQTTPSDVGSEQVVPVEDRTQVLGRSWAESEDRAWTTSGDATGFHVLVADEGEGYEWRTAATLSEPDFAADSWIGNACLTDSGRHAAIAYAPRTFTNDPELMVRGAFTAVVNLETGGVTKLPHTATLGYFSPGCGNGDSAVFTQLTHDGDGSQSTRLIEVDTVTGATRDPIDVAAQVTSAIPAADGIVAAAGHRVVSVNDDGTLQTLADTYNVPFQLTADAGGGVTFIDRTSATEGGDTPLGIARHLTADQIASGERHGALVVAAGDLVEWDLAATARGEVHIAGDAASLRPGLPEHVHNTGRLDKDARVSSHGAAAVTSRWADGAALPVPESQDVGQDAARGVIAEMEILDTGKSITFDVLPRPGAAGGAHRSPALPEPAETDTGGGMSTQLIASTAPSPSDPVEAERTCSVPRNDVKKQALQPTPRQVEWAVDQAVIGELDRHIHRISDWNRTGMASYQPQELFPLTVMAGDPDGVVNHDDEWHIPAQILLGITAQESNMWQANRSVVPGVTGNPLIGNYYGVGHTPDGEQPDPFAINWMEADCGYGITQVTDGMRLPGKGQTTMTPTQQEAVALDYTANIAAGANILIEKWNQTYNAGMTVNDGHPQWIENWFFALWAYNSGFHPHGPDPEGHWGVGWTNNPANPLWKANRTPFLEGPAGGDDYSHAASPQHWPYQEKVIGWAARPISAMFAPGDFQPGYRPAWWHSTTDRTAAKPPIDLFCDQSNHCDSTRIADGDSNDPGQGACNLADRAEGDHWLHCWWNQPAEWKDCSQTRLECGNSLHRFPTSYPEQENGTAYPPDCSFAPAGAIVVDNVADAVTPAGAHARSCGPVHSSGNFTFSFEEENGTYPGKIDLHQIGAGYGNHFWFTHTRKTGSMPKWDNMNVTGTWELGSALNAWGRVLVHLPDHGAHTQQAHYRVYCGTEPVGERYIPTRNRANTWVNIGVFNLTCGERPRVSLSSHTSDGTGEDSMAWDAVAFMPLPHKPEHFIVAMGDSYTSGEGAGDYSIVSDNNYGNRYWNACRRSDNAWARKATLPGHTETIGTLTDNLSPKIDFQFVACSGARTFHMLGNASSWGQDGQFREYPQLYSGVLNDDTTLVALTIGGNDAQFPIVMESCVLGNLSCPSIDTMKDYISETATGVASTLREIHEKAPNARIILMGYPRLLSSDAPCVWYAPDIATRLNTAADYMAQTQEQVAVSLLRNDGLPVYYVSPNSDFEGNRACDDPEGIHEVVRGPKGEGDFSCPGATLCVSRESFHPKGLGTTRYGQAFARAI